MAVDSGKIFGGGVTVFKIGGAAGTDVGATRGGVEISRSLSVHLSEVDQNTAHLKARTIMNEMHVRGAFAEAPWSNFGYSWNIEQAQIQNSSIYMTDSDDDEVEVYFEGPGPDDQVLYFDATRAFAMGDMTFSFARDSDVELPFDFQLLLDTSLTPARFALGWHV
jgi:hypothetical protein